MPHAQDDNTGGQTGGQASDASQSPPSLVLGTAGHIDHGKTTLVHALTGRDLDRLPEEKARGITIELGFAPLVLEDDLRLAVIDVPGHEKFVRTMVAGASGLDLVLLVVAADEGVMPQTREHLAICELLGVDRGLIALTKCDLVDEEMRELAAEDVRDALEGGPLEGSPIVFASAESGEGIEEIRATLARLVRETGHRGDDRRPARLFIDRTFTKHGFGAVVTGTWSGRVARVGDAISIEPGARKARIRGLERHGEPVEATESGARIAVNLQGIATDEVGRGDLLTEAYAVDATTTFDASLRWLSEKTTLEEAVSVELLSGTAERRARVALVGDEPIGAGDRGFGRVHVEGEGLPLLPGDRFVMRGFSRTAGVGATLGGGIVLDVAPPHRRRRDPALLAELERLAKGDPEERVLIRIERNGLEGQSDARLVRELGLDPEDLASTLANLAEREEIVRIDGTRSLGAAAADRLSNSLCEALEAFHEREPLQPGMPRAALAGVLPENVANGVGTTLIARLEARGEVSIRDEAVARKGFSPRLEEADEAIAAKLRTRLGEAGLDAPAMRTIAEAEKLPEGRLREIAHFLDRAGDLIAAPDELFFDRQSVRDLIARVVDHFEREDQLDTQTLKTLIGTSRRTAMPLMALLDDLQVTRRDGSIRRLISAEPRW